jgi:D-arabinose 1-dehydrogenase-like Zn-dependent alcohol dehydrogenase
MVKDGLMPWIQYPRSPGHEIAGTIDEVGPSVTAWKKGQHVGVGWHGGHDGGGYAEYMVAPWEAMSSPVDGLGANGTMMALGAGPDPIEAKTGALLFGNKGLQGWASGIATDSEDTLRFAEYTFLRPMIEKFPLANVNEAYNRMTSGKAQFRVVLTM